MRSIWINILVPAITGLVGSLAYGYLLLLTPIPYWAPIALTASSAGTVMWWRGKQGIAYPSLSNAGELLIVIPFLYHFGLIVWGLIIPELQIAY